MLGGVSTEHHNIACSLSLSGHILFRYSLVFIHGAPFRKLLCEKRTINVFELLFFIEVFALFFHEYKIEIRSLIFQSFLKKCSSSKLLFSYCTRMPFSYIDKLKTSFNLGVIQTF